MLYQVPPRPCRATKDSRWNTTNSFIDGYNLPAPTTPLAPGHDQALFDHQYGVANLRQGGG